MFAGEAEGQWGGGAGDGGAEGVGWGWVFEGRLDGVLGRGEVERLADRKGRHTCIRMGLGFGARGLGEGDEMIL